MLFVLFKFEWKREVCVIINEVAYTSTIKPNGYGNVQGMFYINSGRSGIDSYSLDTRIYVEIEVLKIQKIW